MSKNLIALNAFANFSEGDWRHHRFGIFDEKYRAVGVVTLLAKVEYDHEVHCQKNKRLAPGTYFEVTVQPSRNGGNFGATQNTYVFTTEAKAKAHLEKAVAATRKRYQKKFAR